MIFSLKWDYSECTQQNQRIISPCPLLSQCAHKALAGISHSLEDHWVNQNLVCPKRSTVERRVWELTTVVTCVEVWRERTPACPACMAAPTIHPSSRMQMTCAWSASRRHSLLPRPFRFVRKHHSYFDTCRFIHLIHLSASQFKPHSNIRARKLCFGIHSLLLPVVLYVTEVNVAWMAVEKNLYQHLSWQKMFSTFHLISYPWNVTTVWWRASLHSEEREKLSWNSVCSLCAVCRQ